MPDQTVLFVSHSGGRYGAEASLLDIVTHLPDSFEPIVLVPWEGELTESLQEANIEYHISPYGRWILYENGYCHIFKQTGITLVGLAKYVLESRQIDPDLIYTNTISSPFGGVLSLLSGSPNIWHIREFVEEDHNAKFGIGISRTCRLIELSSDHILYNSKAVKNKYTEFFNDIPEKVIPNGPISKENFDRDQIRDEGVSNPIELLIVGRISEGKNQIQAIEAVAQAKKEGLETHLTIVGDGDPEYIEDCKQKANLLGINDQVTWAGYQENVVDYYVNTDIVLICSQAEAFGRVVVEAMAHGAPIIASSDGALPELISHNETGFLYENTSELVECISYCDEYGERYTKISLNAFELALENYTTEKYTNDIIRTFMKYV